MDYDPFDPHEIIDGKYYLTKTIPREKEYVILCEKDANKTIQDDVEIEIPETHSKAYNNIKNNEIFVKFACEFACIGYGEDELDAIIGFVKQHHDEFITMRDETVKELKTTHSYNLEFILQDDITQSIESAFYENDIQEKFSDVDFDDFVLIRLIYDLARMFEYYNIE